MLVTIQSTALNVHYLRDGTAWAPAAQSNVDDDRWMGKWLTRNYIQRFPRGSAICMPPPRVCWHMTCELLFENSKSVKPAGKIPFRIKSESKFDGWIFKKNGLGCSNKTFFELTRFSPYSK